MAEVGIFVGTMYGNSLLVAGRSGSDPQRTGTQGYRV
ncbi:flavoprotein YqcA [Klebsiella pneumoniae]|uniref:Flavoprotein YqcA n=1 Tax=Klebsiella pneumoniae TaxID=573 RepID=A0A378FMI7_KLEPN|nr:flavoprotein YqcA [Klebsiella pneumoniae]